MRFNRINGWTQNYCLCLRTLLRQWKITRCLMAVKMDNFISQEKKQAILFKLWNMLLFCLNPRDLYKFLHSFAVPLFTRNGITSWGWVVSQSGLLKEFRRSEALPVCFRALTATLEPFCHIDSRNTHKPGGRLGKSSSESLSCGWKRNKNKQRPFCLPYFLVLLIPLIQHAV